MQREIPILSEGLVTSRICIGRKVADAASLLEGDVYLVCDASVRTLADSLIRRVHRRARYDRKEGASAPARIRSVLSLQTGESEKNLYTVMDICRWLLDNGADRKALLLAVGGGITTDMAGFAASVYKRGIRFAYIPTTLLAQVDAAIGGKTGVNFLDLKNMIGVIRQPEWTWICPEPLRTLPLRDFRSGMAEMLKTFLLGDAAHYEPAVALLAEISQAEHPQQIIVEKAAELQELIAAAAAVKAAVVSRDPEEKGERRILNLGHTFAHGIESKSRQAGPDLTHGEAVAIGIIMAAELAEYLGIAGEGLTEKLVTDFVSCGLPTAPPFRLEELEAAMTRDKKAEGDIVHFILPAAVGTVVEKDLSVHEALSLLGAAENAVTGFDEKMKI